MSTSCPLCGADVEQWEERLSLHDISIHPDHLCEQCDGKGALLHSGQGDTDSITGRILKDRIQGRAFSPMVIVTFTSAAGEEWNWNLNPRTVRKLITFLKGAAFVGGEHHSWQDVVHTMTLCNFRSKCVVGFGEMPWSYTFGKNQMHSFIGVLEELEMRASGTVL